MPSDLPPFLSHSPHRNIHWTGHGAFPYASISHHKKLERKWPNHPGYLKDLRIFKLEYDPYGEANYELLNADEIKAYMGEISG